MRFEHAADAPAADRMTLGLHFGAQPPSAVALAVVGKCFAHGHLPGRLYCPHLLEALPGVVRSWGHAQHLAELAHGHLGSALRDVLVGAHRVGWPSLRL
ncbi:hypothetical protein GCM10027346_41890 [Hymenobacter seoulensis]